MCFGQCLQLFCAKIYAKMHYFIMQVGNVSLPEATKKAVEDIRKKVKMPKKYRKANPEDLKVLQFVTTESCRMLDSPVLSFPNKGNEWKEFFTTYRWTALDKGVYLPSNIREWNIIRKSRLYDVFFDLSAAQRWWKVSRLANDLLASNSPPDASLSSGCRALLICPDEVTRLITVMRCVEVGTGLTSLEVEHFRAGTHTCKKCNRPSVPICFKNTRSNCLYEPCSRAIASEANKRKRKREKQEKLQESRAKQVIKRSCSRCRCSISCRNGETEPRRHEETGKLMTNLCWHHRFVNPAVQKLLVHTTQGICKFDYVLFITPHTSSL